MKWRTRVLHTVQYAVFVPFFAQVGSRVISQDSIVCGSLFTSRFSQ